jgi:hypothetical protein
MDVNLKQPDQSSNRMPWLKIITASAAANNYRPSELSNCVQIHAVVSTSWHHPAALHQLEVSSTDF